MNKKLLIGIIVVLGIAAAIFRAVEIGGVAIGVWIFLVVVVWKKKTNIFHDQMEPKLAERRLKRLKAFLLVAGISFAMFCVAFILLVVLVGLLEIIEEESVSYYIGYYIAFVGLGVFVIATIGGLVIFLKGRRKTT